MEQLKRQAAQQIVKAVYDTIKETGEDGAPGGVLYAALMNIGVDYDGYNLIMGTMVEQGLVMKQGELYYALLPGATAQ